MTGLIILTGLVIRAELWTTLNIDLIEKNGLTVKAGLTEKIKKCQTMRIGRINRKRLDYS